MIEISLMVKWEGRKSKGCRNNIFIVNGIIHDVLNKKGRKPVLLQIYDYAQMFDSIELKQAISDIYETGLDDDNLSLVYNANREIFMAVNSPGGLTDRQPVTDIVLQGETWSSLLASVQVDKIVKECQNADIGYKYKENLSIGLLGLVDDLIGVTEVGYQAQMMNSFMNVRTAEKCLQFGIKKCHTMLIGDKSDCIVDNELSVDKWIVNYTDTEVKEEFVGPVTIGKCSEQKYLGFVLSNTGSNMPNIKALKNKSIGTIKQIIIKLESLHLQKYFFECSMIFMKAFLRSSILYASETYYNLRETEVRQLERIEESYMRKIVKTKKSCPISQLYLEFGQSPARFEIQKLRLYFLKYILDEEKESLIRRFLELQIKTPTKNDWASTCKADIKSLNINLSFEEIGKMSANQFKEKVRHSCSVKAFEYLLKKRGRKGCEIQYKEFEMATYLLPNAVLKIDEQRGIFALRNRMNNIPANFCSSEENKERCKCGNIETNEHIYNCIYLNGESVETPFEKIYEGTVIEMKSILKRFEQNLEKRNK